MPTLWPRSPLTRSTSLSKRRATTGGSAQLASKCSCGRQSAATRCSASQVSADDSRNAFIKACSEDFAVVGAAALFLNNVDDIEACVDQAGNASSKTIGLQPTEGIFAPAEGAVGAEPPVVEWVPVSKARFYNVQLWRGNLKLLTTWVKRPKLTLPLRWKMKGARHSLVDGNYRLFVWPAFGTTRDPRYGKPVGQVDFVVKRR